MALTHNWARTPSRPVTGKLRRRFVESSNKPRLTLAQARKRRAMTATELAYKAGVAVSTITRIEQGKTGEKDRPIRFGTMTKIAEALGMRLDEINWPGDPLGLEGDVSP